MDELEELLFDEVVDSPEDELELAEGLLVLRFLVVEGVDVGVGLGCAVELAAAVCASASFF